MASRKRVIKGARDRLRVRDGGIQAKRADTQVTTLRRTYGAAFLGKRQVVERPHGDWAVRRVGSERATKVFSSQKKAIIFARDIAKKEGNELYIHNRDGRVREKASYGSHNGHSGRMPRR